MTGKLNLDPALPASLVGRSQAWVSGPFTAHTLRGTGHFPHEEHPEEFTGLLLSWLATLPAG